MSLAVTKLDHIKWQHIRNTRKGAIVDKVEKERNDWFIKHQSQDEDVVHQVRKSGRAKHS